MSSVANISTSAVVGFDIGGTGIDVEAFPVEANGNINKTPIFKMRQDTAKGLDAHVNQVINMMQRVYLELIKMGIDINSVGIGSPGRFDRNRNIKPLTNTNIGARPEEFDGVNLHETYKKALSNSIVTDIPALSNVPLFVANDGDAMFAGMMGEILSGSWNDLKDQYGITLSKEDLIAKTVSLFGVGTGIGNSYGKVSDDGDGFKFVNDGHASKIGIKLDEEDMQFLQKAARKLEDKTGKKEVFFLEDGSVRSEDLFRDPVVNALCDVEHGSHINFDNPDHDKALKFAGKYMARLIGVVNSGQCQDMDPANGWNDAEKVAASKASIYLIGGGMGRSEVGEAMIKYAAKELENLGLGHIKLVQVKHENVAAYSAATLVPKHVLLGGAHSNGGLPASAALQ